MALALVATVTPACAQNLPRPVLFAPPSIVEVRAGHGFLSERDSLEWMKARALAERARGLRVVISLFDRRLWVLSGSDTLRSAPVGVGMDSTLAWKDTVWIFRTPRGPRTIRDKEAEPVWVPPDWHYVEVAHQYALEVRQLRRGRPATLSGDRRIEVRGEEIHLVESDGSSIPLPAEEEIIFDGVLYVPPFDTRNRRVAGELGRYRLDIGGGYLIHGTPDDQSVGVASTHGCIRLYDADIAWLYENVPVGARVFIY